MISRSKDASHPRLQRIPLHFSYLDVCGQVVENAAETVNIGTNGFLMKSSKKLKLGALLSLKFRVPMEMSGSVVCELRSGGRVVSEHRLEDGTMGYKVEIVRAALHGQQRT
jgi:hypothetical protein